MKSQQLHTNHSQRRARPIRVIWLGLLVLVLAGCNILPQSAADVAPTATPVPPTATAEQPAPPDDLAGTLTPTPGPPNMPTATLPPEDAGSSAGRYENSELGFAFDYPSAWQAEPGEDESTLTTLVAPFSRLVVIAFYSPLPGDAELEEAAGQVHAAAINGIGNVERLTDEPTTLANGRAAWTSEYTGELDDGTTIQVILTSAARGGRIFTLLAFGPPETVTNERETLTEVAASMQLEAPSLYGLARDEVLILQGGESTNPRVYDPATSGGNDLIFSGLVSFNPQLELVPELAASWEISEDGTVYTFHLRENARFHNGRPVTAQDVIYSWERAADPATESDIVLTYLGDIVGVPALHAGEAEQISGLEALDERTLQVTIDAPKPYFLMKLTYGPALIVDRANVESGPEWYRTPNGTGPYRLIRWDRFKLQLYERNAEFYLEPPAIPFVVVQLFSGVGIRMYETGDIDMTGVSRYSVDRVRDPTEPLNADLREGVNMCTSLVRFDVEQPPFDDPKVRQAFALAVDKQTYLDVVLWGTGIPAQGLYPPALPGYNPDLAGLTFDPELARQRLAESSYGSAEALPPIVFTDSGFGGEVDPSVSALAQMWQTHLGVTIDVENLEPNTAYDRIHDGYHGQLFFSSWCADYPDPENFADVLFHAAAQQNLGNYANPELDELLETARVENDVAERIALYQQAEQIIVEDAAAIFLNHGLSYMLVKPYIKNFELTPINVPIERYLELDTAALEG
ncbi:MAG: ABC transporter substrate-binding protein [Chloroflexaceae bacterium]